MPRTCDAMLTPARSITGMGGLTPSAAMRTPAPGARCITRSTTAIIDIAIERPRSPAAKVWRVAAGWAVDKSKTGVRRRHILARDSRARVVASKGRIRSRV